MNNFKVIYKILKALEAAMDYDEADISVLTADNFGITEARFNNIMKMLAENGYITGVYTIDTPGLHGLKLGDVKITLKGLEYLSENSLMRKAANLAKNIKETIPGI